MTEAEIERLAAALHDAECLGLPWAGVNTRHRKWDVNKTREAVQFYRRAGYRLVLIEERT